MTPKVEWQEVTLCDAAGREVGRARVPKRPLLPGIVLWSNRYFRRSQVNDNYLETSCYLVPLENMYVHGGTPTGGPHPEGKK